MEFKFEDTKDHSKGEQEALFGALTEKALTKDYTEFEYIKNVTEWWVMCKAKSGLYKVIELYKRLVAQLYKKYCNQILRGDLDPDLLFVLRQYQECLAFYRVELETTEAMLSEYWAYVFDGHFIDQWLLFRERESWHLWDHRGDNDGE